MATMLMEKNRRQTKARQQNRNGQHLVADDVIQQVAQDPHFRVAIFGSARTKKEDQRYKHVYELAKKIGKHDMGVVTGGGPGLMEAANAGHEAGHTKGSGRARSIGLTIELPFEAGSNGFLDVEKHFMRFSNRLDTFMLLSQAVVVTPGGIGTCLELFYSWQLTQVKHICSIPIILYGEMWESLMDWFYEQPMKKGTVSPGDDHNIYVAHTVDDVMKILLHFHDVYEKEGDNYCLNYKKYKIGLQ